MFRKFKFKVIRKVYIFRLSDNFVQTIAKIFHKNLHNLQSKIFEASKILRHLKMNQRRRWIFGQKSSKLRRSLKLRCNTDCKANASESNVSMAKSYFLNEVDLFYFFQYQLLRRPKCLSGLMYDSCQCCNEASKIFKASKIFVRRSIFVFIFGSFSDAEESSKLRRF